MLPAGPARRLVEEGVLVEVRERPEPLRRRPVAEHRPDRRREHLLEVQVDGADRPVEIDVLVHEQAGREEHLERADPALVQGQAAARDERVPPEALGIDRAHRDAREVGVPAHVVEVVDGEHARQQRLERPHPAGHRRVHERRLRDQERDPARVDRLAVGEPVAVRDGARRPAQAADQRPELALDHQLREVLVRQRLGPGPAWVGGRRERREELLVEEVRERPVPHVVEEARDPQRLDDEPLGRDGLARRELAERRPQRRVQRARPQPGLVHDAQAVGEPRVLRRREHPSGALELADPPEALDPRGVEEVVLGDVLGGSPAARDSSAPSRLVSST